MVYKKMQTLLILTVVSLLFIVLTISVFITVKNNNDQLVILEESVKSNLISISIAARGLIDIDKFEGYNSLEDVEADREAYNQMLEELRFLQRVVGATYIYALKQIDGEYYFIFDTDYEDEEIFVTYELSPVHERAFLGIQSSYVLNVDDYGSFNTGAVPILKNRKVIGIICTDIEDNFIRTSKQAATINVVILVVMLTAVMSINIVLIRSLVIKPLSRLTD
ncbi:MAG: hypothetical protein FWE66_04445, partial [Oscillospiraceae bacterium]|nr:hypothetical protein [Oscillospiraceae bacterium]